MIQRRSVVRWSLWSVASVRRKMGNMTFYEREWFSPSIWISPFYSVLFARSVPYLFFLEGVWVRSTEVENMENMIQEWYVFKKKEKNIDRKKWLSRCCMALTTSLFPTEGMVGVVAYLVTCWPDREKKIEVCLRVDNRTEKMEPSSLINCHRLSSNSLFSVSPLILWMAPFLLLVFISSPFWVWPKKLRGCGSRRATNPLVPCHFVFCWTSMNRLHKLPWSWPKLIDFFLSLTLLLEL